MPNDVVTVRPAVLGDAEALARVHTESWQAAYRGIVPDDYLDGLRWTERVERWQRRLAAPVHRSEAVLVAAQDGDVCGFAHLGPARDTDTAGLTEIYAIYVEATAWGRGTGAALIHAALDRVPTGTPAVTLWVFEANAQARRFYRRHGFAPDGTSKVESIGGRELTEIRYRRPGRPRRPR